MGKLTRRVILGVLAAWAVGCEPSTTPREREALYLRVEVEHEGRTVAAPHLLGFEGRHIVVEKRGASSAQLDYRMDLVPQETGAAYAVRFDLELPDGRKAGRMRLLHGEERSVVLDGQTQVRVMLMRVDSPEFRALVMREPARKAAI